MINSSRLQGLLPLFLGVNIFQVKYDFADEKVVSTPF